MELANQNPSITLSCLLTITCQLRNAITTTIITNSFSLLVHRTIIYISVQFQLIELSSHFMLTFGCTCGYQLDTIQLYLIQYYTTVVAGWSF